MGPFGGSTTSAVGEGASTGAGGPGSGAGGMMIGAGGGSVGPLGMPSMMYQKLKNDKNTDKQEQDESSIDVSSPRDNNSPIVSISTNEQPFYWSLMISFYCFKPIRSIRVQFGVLPKSGEREKLLPKQKNWFGKEIDPNSKSSKESKESRSVSKTGGKLSKSAAAAAAAAASQQPSLASFKQSDKNLVPLFVEKCVKFIEQEGLDSEGIYRVPGNRTHVDLLYQKFEEGKR